MRHPRPEKRKVGHNLLGEIDGEPVDDQRSSRAFHFYRRLLRKGRASISHGHIATRVAPRTLLGTKFVGSGARFAGCVAAC